MCLHAPCFALNLAKPVSVAAVAYRFAVVLPRAHLLKGRKVINNYKVIKRIGEGAFGKIKLVFNLKDEDFYVFKKFNKMILQKKNKLISKDSMGSTLICLLQLRLGLLRAACTGDFLNSIPIASRNPIR